MHSPSEEPQPAPRLPAVRRDDLAPEDVALFDDIAVSRGGMPTSFRVFLNSPNAARAISDFGKHVRWGSGLGDRLTEIVCLRVAAVLNDQFMWVHHAVLAREAGLTEDEIGHLQRPEAPVGLDRHTRELVAFIDAELRSSMTDDEFGSVAARIGPEATMELALTVAYYAMIHVLFATLRLDSRTDTRVPLEAILMDRETSR